MQDISTTPDKVLNGLAYGSPFCVIIYKQAVKMVRFFVA